MLSEPILAAQAAWNLKLLLRDLRRRLLSTCMAVTMSIMSEMVTQLLLIVLYAVCLNV